MLKSTAIPIRNQWNGRKRSSQAQWKYFCTSGSVGSFQKAVVRSIGILLLFAQDKLGADILFSYNRNERHKVLGYYDNYRNIHQIRAEFWRRLDRRLDHHGLARHRKLCRV